MSHDPIGDMLTRLRNAALSRHPTVGVINTKTNRAIARILRTQGFLNQFKVPTNHKGELKLYLGYQKSKSKIHHLQRLSRPSLRLYCKSREIPRILNGLGEIIMTTSKGIMTGREAVVRKLGGEVLLNIW